MSDQLSQDIDKLYTDGKAKIEAWVQQVADAHRQAALKKLETAISNAISSATSAGVMATIKKDAEAAIAAAEKEAGKLFPSAAPKA